MKSKKKFLLLGVGAMSVLAIGVGATSTFAWYRAESSARLTGEATKGNISVTKVESVVESPLTADFELRRVGNGEFLQLSDYGPSLVDNEDTTPKYRHYAWNLGNDLVEVDLANNHQASWGYRLYLSDSEHNNHLTADEIAAINLGTSNSEKHTLVIANETSAQLKAWASGSSIADNAVPSIQNEALVTEVQFTLPELTQGGFAGGVALDAYVGFYVYGGDGEALNADNAFTNLTLKVSVS